MDNITPNHYLVFEAAIQDLEISRIKPFWCPQSITDNATPNWSCGLLYADDESLREAGCSESDLEEEEEEEDGGSQHTEDSGRDDAMAENSNAESERSPANEDCETEERLALTQLELATGEAEQSEQTPSANEDREAEVEENQCALIWCFWQCCSVVLQGIQRRG